jgi:citrate lyase subunit beta/citryl-CoA lyase
MARIEAAVRRLRPDNARVALPEINEGTVCASGLKRVRRSRLYLPGTTPKFFLNAGLHKPDAIILDLEDSVPPAEKDTARLLVRNALRTVSFYGAEKMVRINQLPLGLEDVRAIVAHGVQTIVIPKVEDADQVAAVHDLIVRMQRDGAVSGDIYLLPIIESARGILQAFAIASAAPTVAGLAIGLEDFTADIGAQRTRDGQESQWATGQIVVAARAAGVQPLASVYSDVADEKGLFDWARQQRLNGFDGMGCLHPRQIRIIHAAFAPDRAEVEKAERVVAAFEEARAAGRGVVAIDGKMIDAPVVERAQRTLQLARLDQNAAEPPAGDVHP